MGEGLSASEVGKEIAEHREHTTAEPAAANHARRDRWVSIIEAVLLSLVALLAAWSGYSAAKWGTESSLSLAKAATTRSKANLDQTQTGWVCNRVYYPVAPTQPAPQPTTGSSSPPAGGATTEQTPSGVTILRGAGG